MSADNSMELLFEILAAARHNNFKYVKCDDEIAAESPSPLSPGPDPALETPLASQVEELKIAPPG